MIEYETVLKTWGNSVGVVVPKDSLKREKLPPNSKVRITVAPAKKLKVKDIFGKLSSWKKPTGKMLSEIRKDLDSKFF